MQPPRILPLLMSVLAIPISLSAARLAGVSGMLIIMAEGQVLRGTFHRRSGNGGEGKRGKHGGSDQYPHLRPRFGKTPAKCWLSGYVFSTPYVSGRRHFYMLRCGAPTPRGMTMADQSGSASAVSTARRCCRLRFPGH